MGVHHENPLPYSDLSGNWFCHAIAQMINQLYTQIIHAKNYFVGSG